MSSFLTNIKLNNIERQISDIQTEIANINISGSTTINANVNMNDFSLTNVKEILYHDGEIAITSNNISSYQNFIPTATTALNMNGNNVVDVNTLYFIDHQSYINTNDTTLNIYGDYNLNFGASENINFYQNVEGQGKYFHNFSSFTGSDMSASNSISVNSSVITSSGNNLLLNSNLILTNSNITNYLPTTFNNDINITNHNINNISNLDFGGIHGSISAVNAYDLIINANSSLFLEGGYAIFLNSNLEGQNNYIHNISDLLTTTATIANTLHTSTIVIGSDNETLTTINNNLTINGNIILTNSNLTNYIVSGGSTSHINNVETISFISNKLGNEASNSLSINSNSDLVYNSNLVCLRDVINSSQIYNMNWVDGIPSTINAGVSFTSSQRVLIPNNAVNFQEDNFTFHIFYTDSSLTNTNNFDFSVVILDQHLNRLFLPSLITFNKSLFTASNHGDGYEYVLTTTFNSSTSGTGITNNMNNEMVGDPTGNFYFTIMIHAITEINPYNSQVQATLTIDGPTQQYGNLNLQSGGLLMNNNLLIEDNSNLVFNNDIVITNTNLLSNFPNLITNSNISSYISDLQKVYVSNSEWNTDETLSIPIDVSGCIIVNGKLSYYYDSGIDGLIFGCSSFTAFLLPSSSTWTVDSDISVQRLSSENLLSTLNITVSGSNLILSPTFTHSGMYMKVFISYDNF